MQMPDKAPEILLIQTNYVRTLIGMLSKVEADIHPYIEQVGLPENILTTEHRYVPEIPVRNLIEVIAAKSSDAQFQQLSWQACKQIFIPSIVKKISQATTINEALLEAISILKIESSNSQLSLQNVLGQTWFSRHKQKVTNNEKWYELSEQFSVIYMIELIRAITNSDWAPTQLSLQNEDAHEFKKMLFSVGIINTQLFAGRNYTAVNIKDTLLTKKFNAKLQWKTQQRLILQPKSFIESLKIALPAYLFAGKLPIAKAASVIGLSVRTLQRRLKEQNFSYRQILDEIQINQAKQLLENSPHPITAISTHLGYSNVAHFSRAFKRVTGESPSAFRLQSQALQI